MTKITIVSVLAAGLFALPAFGDTVTIDFTQTGGPGGTLNSTGTGGSLVPIGSITISGAPMNNGTFAVTGTCGSGKGCLTFTSAGSLNLVGVITAIGVTGVLMSSGSITTVYSTTPGNQKYTLSGSDTKPDLLAALGLPSNTTFVLTGSTSGPRGGKQSGKATATTLTNVGTFTVPEPGSITLLAAFLLGSACLARVTFARKVD